MSGVRKYKHGDVVSDDEEEKVSIHDARATNEPPPMEPITVIHPEPDERAGDELFDEPLYEEESKDVDEEKKHARSIVQPASHTIEFMKNLAIGRGGKCISDIYNGIGENLTWQCRNEHTWNATPRNVYYNNSWCPVCKGNVGEELVRATLIEAFPGKIFDRTRRVESLNGLELDGYNSELKLAFEYQGVQHFKYVPHFHRKEGQFEAQRERDTLKRECCRIAEITLLEVPYTIKFGDLRREVRKMLVDREFAIADMTLTDAAFYDLCRAGSYENTRLELAKKIAIEKGGICRATKYIAQEIKMPFTCKLGHEFEASFQEISQPPERGPRFCPKCGGTQKKKDDEIRDSLAKAGYQFISVYSKQCGERARRYITVQCPANHPSYEVEISNAIDGDGSLKKGCKKCQSAAHGKALRSDISLWSKETGIDVIGEYTGRNKNHQWKCSQGHVFESTFVSLKARKNPCKICKRMGFVFIRAAAE